MTWFSNSDGSIQLASKQQNPKDDSIGSITCPSCGHSFHLQDQGGVEELARLPAGVKFDPSDHEILQHLEAKLLLLSSTHHQSTNHNNHSLIDQFIPTLQGENGICYTHPEKLPGVSKDGQIRHFFHRPSKAYTTGTRKRRKVNTDDEDGSETRWHKTGKTRPFFIDGSIKGFKKILVLYTNYGRQRKPEKTNWVMHQYHLGHNEEEKDGELVVSKVFYQTQPRQCASSTIKDSYLTKSLNPNDDRHYYNPAAISFTGYGQEMSDLVVEGDHHGSTNFGYKQRAASKEVVRSHFA